MPNLSFPKDLGGPGSFPSVTSNSGTPSSVPVTVGLVTLRTMTLRCPSLFFHAVGPLRWGPSNLAQVKPAFSASLSLPVQHREPPYSYGNNTTLLIARRLADPADVLKLITFD